MRRDLVVRLMAVFLCVVVVCAVPVWSQSPGPCKSTATGDLRVQSFTSATFGDSQTIRVWLPPGYDAPANAGQSYPVLVMLDGQNLFDVCTSGFGSEWQIDETLMRLIASGRWEPLIVVGIDNAGARRSDEFLPYPDASFSDGKEPPWQCLSEVCD